jgi:hypothetical protein
MLCDWQFVCFFQVLFWSDKQLQAKLDVLREAMPGENMSKVRVVMKSLLHTCAQHMATMTAAVARKRAAPIPLMTGLSDPVLFSV